VAASLKKWWPTTAGLRFCWVRLPARGNRWDRGKPGSRLERHGFDPQGSEREGVSRRAQRPLCGRENLVQPHQAHLVLTTRLGPSGDGGIPVKAWVEGNPRELVLAAAAMQRRVELRDGTNPRGRGKRWLRSPWTNDAEEGLLAKGEPLSRRRASKGRDASEEGRSSANVGGRLETRRTP